MVIVSNHDGAGAGWRTAIPAVKGVHRHEGEPIQRVAHALYFRKSIRDFIFKSSLEIVRVQLKVEEKPCQAKRERKTYVFTFKLVKSEGRRPVAIQAAVPFASSFQKTEPPPGLPRRYAPRF
jgi:hypothetical protein